MLYLHVSTVVFNVPPHISFFSSIRCELVPSWNNKNRVFIEWMQDFVVLCENFEASYIDIVYDVLLVVEVQA